MINRFEGTNSNCIVNTNGSMPFRVDTPYIFTLNYNNNSAKVLLSLSSYAKDDDYGAFSTYNILFYKYKKSISQLKKR